MAVVGMLGFESTLNLLIPSGSGQAAVTMPLMAPLADILGLTRQTAVLAFTCGDGFSNTVIPTSGILMAMLALAKIPYGTWLRFMLPLFLHADGPVGGVPDDRRGHRLHADGPRQGLYADPSLYDILHTPGTAAEVTAWRRSRRRLAAGTCDRSRLWFEPACGTGTLPAGGRRAGPPGGGLRPRAGHDGLRPRPDQGPAGAASLSPT